MYDWQNISKMREVLKNLSSAETGLSLLFYCKIYGADTWLSFILTMMKRECAEKFSFNPKHVSHKVIFNI